MKDIFDSDHFCRDCNNPSPEDTFARLVWVTDGGAWWDAEPEDIAKRLQRRRHTEVGTIVDNGGGVFACTDCGATFHGAAL